jgi:hypothetical protein
VKTPGRSPHSVCKGIAGNFRRNVVMQCEYRVQKGVEALQHADRDLKAQESSGLGAVRRQVSL